MQDNCTKILLYNNSNLELQIDLLLADPAFQSNTEQEWESGEWYRE